MTTLRHAYLAGLVVTVLLSTLCTPALSAPVLVAASYDGVIYDVNPLTGEASNPRHTGIDYISGIAFSADGTLYAQSGEFGSPPATLYTIDLQTGAATLQGYVGKTARDIDVDPTTNKLYGIMPWPGMSYAELYTIDTGSGVPTSIGAAPGGIVKYR